jgi:hypothetical protein
MEFIVYLVIYSLETGNIEQRLHQNLEPQLVDAWEQADTLPAARAVYERLLADPTLYMAHIGVPIRSTTFATAQVHAPMGALLVERVIDGRREQSWEGAELDAGIAKYDAALAEGAREAHLAAVIESTDWELP